MFLVKSLGEGSDTVLHSCVTPTCFSNNHIQSHMGYFLSYRLDEHCALIVDPVTRLLGIMIAYIAIHDDSGITFAIKWQWELALRQTAAAMLFPGFVRCGA